MTKSKGIKKPNWAWTTEHDQLLRQRYADTKKRDLAQMIGCTESNVLNRAWKLGIKTPGGATRIGLKKSPEALAALKAAMRKASEEGRLKAPPRHTIEAGLLALQRPDVIAKRAARAAKTMRGRPQRIDCLSAAAEHNARAKTYTVISPSRNVYTFTNLKHFVRENSWLFDSKDTKWKDDGNWCRASMGLYGLFRTKPNSTWKGWIAVRKKNPQTPHLTSEATQKE